MEIELETLRKENERAKFLETTLASINDAVIATDANKRITLMNTAAESLTGWKAANAFGRSLEEVFTVISEESGKPILDLAILGERDPGRTFAALLIAKNSEELPVDFSVSPIRKNSGNLAGCVYVFRDVGLRRKQQKKLAERAAFAAFGRDVGLALTQVESLEDMLERCTEAMAEHLGAALACIWTLKEGSDQVELRAHSGDVSLGEWENERVRLGQGLIGQIAESGKSRLMHTLSVEGTEFSEFLLENGLSFFAGYPLLIESRVVGVVGMHSRKPYSGSVIENMESLANSIALGIERLRSDQKIRESEERVRMAVQAANIGTWDFDLTTETLRWSDRCKEIFGMSPEDPIDYEIFLKHLHPDDRERTDLQVSNALDSGGTGSYKIDYRAVWPDGTIRWIVATGEAFFEGQGANRHAVRFVGTVLDITDRKDAEERLREVAARLSEADHRKDVFLATLAHELRNPLAPIRTGLEVMKLAEGDPAILEEVREMMERQTKQMIALVDDLLDVSRITRGRLELRESRVNLSEVLRNAVESSRPFVDESGHNLTVESPDQPVYLKADPHRLAQILSNLLNNAAKYTPNGGEIRVRAELVGSDVRISVADNGIGIPADMKDQIFEMFAQVEHAKEHLYTGLGIGLTLVKSLVEMHGGRVEVLSEGQGKGSEFYVFLPVLDAETDEVERDEEATPEKERESERKRVLVVDDNKTAADMLGRVLEIQGSEVRVANDGEEGIKVAEAFRPRIIFLDLGMPRLDGYEAARLIRETDWGREVYLVALTGWGAEADRKRTKEAGFDQHLVKPAEPSVLVDLIRSI